MSEPKKPPEVTRASEVSARLEREAGLLAGRLAHFIAASLPSVEGAIAEGRAFLHALFEAVSEGRPLSSWLRNPLDRQPQGAPHPLDLLSQGLALAPAEVELLLLAGLSEEHEGLAALLRTLHPRG